VTTETRQLLVPQIREAGPDDLDRVLSLYAHLNPGDALPEQAAADQIWRSIQSSRAVLVLLAEIDKSAVATCMLTIIPNLTRGGRPYAVIENVVTHSDFRNQGLGKAILAAAVARAQEANCYKVTLTTGSKRESTLSFYEAAGFSRNTRTVFERRISSAR